MEFLKRVFIGVLVVLTLNLYFPRSTFAQQSHLHAKADVTEHSPESRTTPQKDIPGKKSRKWLWWVLGALVVAGGAAAAGGGGGGGGGDDAGGGNNDGGGDDTGEITGSW